MSARPTLSVAVALPPFIAACPAPEEPPPPPPAVGSLEVCLPIDAGDSTLMEVTGTVVARDDSYTCTRSITVETEDGSVHTVGWTVQDDTGRDQTPETSVALGDVVTVGMRAHMVFGAVHGLMVHDDDGLVLAADEGTWGGGLLPEETGVVVAPGALLATVENDCSVLDYHALSFTFLETGEAPEHTLYDVPPLSVDEHEQWTVHTVASIVRGPGDRCEASDQTDEHAWVISRYW